MTLATDPQGDLRIFGNCYIQIPRHFQVTPNPDDPEDNGIRNQIELVGLNNLPDITDSKSVSYSDEPIIGRAMPLKTYSHSENRVITTKIDFFVTNNSTNENLPGSAAHNLRKLRALQSACYPLNNPGGLGVPYAPPPVCKIVCGKILGDDGLCVVMTNYDITYHTDVAWDEMLMLPYKTSISCSWHVVYNNSFLPGQERILSQGR